MGLIQPLLHHFLMRADLCYDQLHAQLAGLSHSCLIHQKLMQLMHSIRQSQEWLQQVRAGGFKIGLGFLNTMAHVSAGWGSACRPAVTSDFPRSGVSLALRGPMREYVSIRLSCAKSSMSLCNHRELGPAISTVSADRVRPLTIMDFDQALQAIKPSVNQSQLAAFEKWTQDFGTSA